MAAHEARRAVRIIDDLFDLCASSRGRLSLRKEVMELVAVVTMAADAVLQDVAKKLSAVDSQVKRALDAVQ